MSAMPCGMENWDASPTPSAQPASPLPASVATAPSGEIVRMRLPSWSEMKTVPSRAAAIPTGVLNVAAAASPSSRPNSPVPATVRTLRVDRTHIRV